MAGVRVSGHGGPSHAVYLRVLGLFFCAQVCANYGHRLTLNEHHLQGNRFLFSSSLARSPTPTCKPVPFMPRRFAPSPGQFYFLSAVVDHTCETSSTTASTRKKDRAPHPAPSPTATEHPPDARHPIRQAFYANPPGCPSISLKTDDHTPAKPKTAESLTPTPSHHPARLAAYTWPTPAVNWTLSQTGTGPHVQSPSQLARRTLSVRNRLIQGNSHLARI